MGAATPILERLIGATVRLDNGSGVLVENEENTVLLTAYHVAKKDQRAESDEEDEDEKLEDEQPPSAVRVWTGGVPVDCHVLAHNKGADLVVASAPRAFDGRGLSVVEEERDLLPGEEVWTCGHPRGWPDEDAPVLCRGIVAGVGRECWANLEASWGNSGGALLLADGKLGGVALGKAGRSLNTLDDVRGQVKEEKPLMTLVAERMSYARTELETLYKLLEDDGDKIRAAMAKRPDAEKLLATLAHIETQRPANERALAESRHWFQIEQAQSRTLSTLTDLIDRHFRTGFIRFAPASAVRQLLGR